MSYNKSANGSYLHNCYVKRRDSDPAPSLFTSDDGTDIFCSLNGYAIIPMEEYAVLVGMDFAQKQANIKAADEELHEKQQVREPVRVEVERLIINAPGEEF